MRRRARSSYGAGTKRIRFFYEAGRRRGARGLRRGGREKGACRPADPASNPDTSPSGDDGGGKIRVRAVATAGQPLYELEAAVGVTDERFFLRGSTTESNHARGDEREPPRRRGRGVALRRQRGRRDARKGELASPWPYTPEVAAVYERAAGMLRGMVRSRSSYNDEYTRSLQ